MSAAWGPAARAMVGTLVDIGHTRLELAATELELARVHMADQALVLLVGVLLAALGLGFATLAALLFLSPEQRPLVLAALAGVCLVAAGLLARRWRRLQAASEPLLQATLDELRKDREALAAALRVVQ